ncbi:MAG: type II toxin-antitoxin system RelE/ParE family toxin [Coriobacteriia bacterium]|nr:type II toxin-antitoxin system RelE/ParE family toxin [Coriobacteriia bacterium]MCL2605672.1 type II toxin-antitoxin system RelE/ParE family toxin [Coriobacteriia bacterium]
MTKLVVQPAAGRYFKKLKDKKLQQLFKDTIAAVLENPSLGEMKRGDLSGIQCVDVFHNKTNYEVAYRVVIVESAEGLDDTVVVVILAGTRENFYAELKRHIKRM